MSWVLEIKTGENLSGAYLGINGCGIFGAVTYPQALKFDSKEIADQSLLGFKKTPITLNWDVFEATEHEYAPSHDPEWNPDIYDEALKLWGSDLQLGMLQEEAAEVIQAVSKVKRGSHPYILMEEIADLEIMIEQAKRVFKCQDKIAEIKIKKLKKLQGLIDKAKNPSDSDGSPIS